METELNMGFKVFPVEPYGFRGIGLQQVKAEVTAYNNQCCRDTFTFLTSLSQYNLHTSLVYNSRVFSFFRGEQTSPQV